MHNYFHIYKENEHTFVWPHHRNRGETRDCQACCVQPQKPPTKPTPKPANEKISFKFGKIRVDVKNAQDVAVIEEGNMMTLRITPQPSN